MLHGQKRKQGCLIVIDGTDGTGKTTQTSLLVKHLKEAGYKVGLADFPRYGLPSAYFVEQYLKGRYGPADTVDPYTASLFYALDRYDANRLLKKQLTKRQVVVSNRYVTANLGHQGGKIRSAFPRRRYFRWVDKLEHDLLGLPRPNLTIILHVPATLAQRLVDRKGRRAYISCKRDLHEADLEHLRAAEQTYLEIVRLFPRCRLVECVERGKLLSPPAIHEKIWTIVKKVLFSDL